MLGVGAKKKVYIDNVFSPTVWRGDGTNNRDIVNNLDLSTEGGMVWIKRRNEDRDHSLFDTIRGAGKMVSINDNTSEDNETNTLTQFNTNGFRINSDNFVNSDTNKYVSWSFRKCPKFFTMASWSGNATSGRAISHDLGSVPGMIIVKCSSSNGHASAAYHRKAHPSSPADYFYPINTGGGATDYQHAWNDGAPTATQFYLGNNADFNGSGKDYVAWIFAHNNNDGEFGGQSGSNGDVIKCDSYTGNGSSSGLFVDLGWEPQWILIKKRVGNYDSHPWHIYDSMRRIASGGDDDYIRASYANAEVTNGNHVKVNPRGFTIETSNSVVNDNGEEFIYVAIRRRDPWVGTPFSSATELFAMDTGASRNYTPNYDSGFPVDLALKKYPGASGDWRLSARLFGTGHVITNSAASASTYAGQTFDSDAGFGSDSNGSEYQAWMWRRHSGLDVIHYQGNGTSNRDLYHGLNNTPKMIWAKRLDDTEHWAVYHFGLNSGSSPQNYTLYLSAVSAETSSQLEWGSSNTSTFTLGEGDKTNKDGKPYLAVLFADTDFSKVGWYTGNGNTNTQTITTGFQPRFILLKRISSSEDWYIYDSLRGMGSGNDKYLRLNVDGDQNTSYNSLEALSTGFRLEANDGGPEFNATNDRYIYYAQA